MNNKKFKCNKLKRSPLDEDFYMNWEILVLTHPKFIAIKVFKDLINELNKRHAFFERAEILRSKNTVINDLKVNNLNINKTIYIYIIIMFLLKMLII